MAVVSSAGRTGMAVMVQLIRVAIWLLLTVAPLVRVILALNLVYQFVRMVWLWHEPAAHPALVFGAWFGLSVAFELLVGYAPGWPDALERRGQQPFSR